MMIELTMIWMSDGKECKNAVSVNPEHISHVSEMSNGHSIVFINDRALEVEESRREVQTMVEQTGTKEKCLNYFSRDSQLKGVAGV